jgi:RNA-directed DNA polymerase
MVAKANVLIFLVTHLSSNWNNGSNASTTYWNLNNSSANRNRNIGTHLLCVGCSKMVGEHLPCLLAKHKKCTNSRAGSVCRTLDYIHKALGWLFVKRYGNVYSSICELDNIICAHHNARKGKSHYKEVMMVNCNEELYLKRISETLMNKTYKTSPYVIETIIDKGKEREIYKLPYYPDRIVHWAIMLQIEDVFMRTFIRDTFASLPQRGIHDGLKRLHYAMHNKSETTYCLKMDVRKFFPSIDHAILKSLLRKKFKDEDLLWLLDEIIDSVNGEKGVPIGNYLSQYFANYYLTFFDHWLKEEKGVKRYFRYMDDMVILHPDKKFLHGLRVDIDDYLNTNLGLTLKDNWQVFPTFVRGIDFLGYRSFGDYTLLRKSTAKRLKRKMTLLYGKEMLSDSDMNCIASYKGWSKWCNGYNLERKYIKPLEVIMNDATMD